MKNGSKFLGALLLCISMLMVSCSNGSSDEASTRNEVVMNGKSYQILGARMEGVLTPDGVVGIVPIDLWLNEDGSSYLSVECEKLDLGKTIDLNDKEGNWRIEYANGDFHRTWFSTWNASSGTGTYSGYELMNGSNLRMEKRANGEYIIDVIVKWKGDISDQVLTGHYEGKLYNAE